MPRRGNLVALAGLLVSWACAAAALTALSDDDLRNLPSPGSEFDIDNGALLAPILIPRVSGTEGNFKVQRHFVDFFKKELPDWEILWQNSTSTTPVTGDKQVPFSNLIIRRDPPESPAGDVGRLTLVAHYDSKYSPTGFVGAVDSAAPCAMLMFAAKAIDEALTAKWKAMKESGDDMLQQPEGVQILFLDGEEAFRTWTSTDSLYGSRSLAEQWDGEFHAAMSAYRTPLDSISLFVLLDLLGSADPVVPSYFLTTNWAYSNMGSLEQRMRKLGLLEAKPRNPFLPEAGQDIKHFGRGYIEDDHVPFMKRGVEILHIIPSPFPDVWHKMEDDGEHLDLPTVRDWAKIVTAFTVEWMDLKDHMPKRAVKPEKRSETTGSVHSKRTEL
ncbi:peptidase family M28-domain-containing protein [Stachybotrys elegans]|uniref:Peptide hydrolase n=1 Tax=Stachybotrys elegans TaxID=80388 RepID=A0A8K0WNZ6_9HYPO|nr:peptidase family M28-domain-containing protein [Stachybotrys elegans]